jgi:hypothetical protein
LITTIELSGSISALGFAPGNAAAGRVGASAKEQAANPINKSRFMFPPELALIARRKNQFEFSWFQVSEI